MRRYPIWWIFFAITTLAGYGLWEWWHHPSENSTPSPGRTADISAAEIRQLQNQIADNLALLQQTPEATAIYPELAGQYLQLSRRTGLHDTYVPRALTLLDKALAREPGNFSALLRKAEVRLIQHRFDEAQRLAQTAVKQYPHSAAVYGLLCDAAVQLGDYSAAVAACDRMLSIRPDLPAYSRAAYLRELHGDIDGAIAAMKLAAAAGVTGRYDRAWALVQLGNLYLQRGAVDTAAFVYEGVLQERPNFAPALAGLADVAVARQNYPRAAGLLETAYRNHPNHGFEEKLAAIYQAMGETGKAETYISAALNGYQKHAAAGWNVNLEFARFCGDFRIRLTEALERMEKEYETRPENVDVLDTYAWVLHQLGRHEAAAQKMRQALRLNTPQPAMRFRAAVIFRAAGEHDLAAQYQAQCKALQSVLPVQYRGAFTELTQEPEWTAMMP